MAINFFLFKDSDETRTVHTKSDNTEIMMGSETDEIIKELFKFVLQRCQEGLEESMKGSEFIFDSVDVLYYDLNKIRLNKAGSYKNSSEWLKNKKATINPKNNDDKCFQYALNCYIKLLKHQKQSRKNIKNLLVLLISIIGKK